MKTARNGMIVSGIITLVLVLVAFTGCASFLTKAPTENDVAMSQLAITNAATITAVEKPEWVPEMLKVSELVIGGMNAGKITTLADVRALINKEAADRHFSQKTITYVNLFMNNMIFIIEQKGQVSLNVPVQLCMTAQWINNAIGGSATCTVKLVTVPTKTQ